MVSEIVPEIIPVVAPDQYAEKKSLPSSLHLGPSPSIISERQLPVSSTIVKYALHDLEIYSKKYIQLFPQSSVKSPDKLLLGLSRLRA